MFNSIRAEFYKLNRSNGFKIIMLLNILLYIAMAFLMQITPDMIPSDLPDEVIVTLPNMIIQGYEAFYTSLSQSQIIFIASFIGIFVCSDFSNRTLGLAVSSGKTRFSMLIGKTVPVMYGTFLILIVCPLAMSLVLTMYNGFGAELTFSLFTEMLVDFIMYLLINLSITSVCVLIAYILKSTGATISVSIGLVVLYSSLAAFPMGDLWNTITKLTPFYYIGNMTSIQTTADIIYVTVVCLATFLISTGFSYITLKNTELK